MTAMMGHLLHGFARVLEDAGYVVRHQVIGDLDNVLMAESAYAIIACFESDTWAELEQKCYDVQAALTQYASDDSGPRRWDLYVVVHMTEPSSGDADDAAIERIEADTRYARKFVRVVVDQEDELAIERALRPLLPLRPRVEMQLVDPLDALRSELYGLDIEHPVVDEALESFREREEVVVR